MSLRLDFADCMSVCPYCTDSAQVSRLECASEQKLNGRLRIPDAALTLFAKTDTHTNTYTLMPHCLLKLSTGHRVDQKEERSAGCLNMNMNQGGGEEEANNIPDIGR